MVVARTRACAGVVLALAATTAAARAQQRKNPPPTGVLPSPSPPSRGWTSHQALELAKEGIDAHQRGDEQLCVARDQASLAVEEHPWVRLHLATCLAALGRVREALGAANVALGVGIRESDAELRRVAQDRVEKLLARVAHVQLALPKDVDGIAVTINGAPLRQRLGDAIPVDPGTVTVSAARALHGEKWTFAETLTLADGESRRVEVLFAKSALSDAELECLRRATTYEEKLDCIKQVSVAPKVHVGVDMSGYTDSLHVNVLSPAVNASVTSPTAGWNVGGSYLVDVVSAASPDIVSMASPPFKEVRHAGSLDGGVKIGDVDGQVQVNASSEPDYVVLGAGGSVAVDLDRKSITPRVGYAYGHDRIGIRNSPFSAFEQHLDRHEIETGVTLVVDKATLVVLGVSVEVDRGEQAKLYRFVPMFAKGTEGDIHPGEPVDSVNEKRLNIRPREVLPRERDRYAVGARLNHRVGEGTIRVDERLYTDTWAVKATTTDARYLHDLGEHLRVWPHLRVHAQTAASFYRLAYPAILDQNGVVIDMLPYRTGDRELSPMFTLTGGGGARVALNADKTPGAHYAIILSGEAMWSKFFRSLFVTQRTAVYGTAGFEVEL
jgi:hypothetical protein